jgi:hypothetical protein
MVLGVLAALTLLTTACGKASTVVTSAPARSSSTTRAPEPAGKNPSAISKEVCADDAQSEIKRVLGVSADVATPTWAAHLYSCRYRYPNGTFVLSVKELSSWSQTYAYFDSIKSSEGDTGPLGNLGQAAFTTANGSVVVRKDWKVLVVNIAPLPKQFGKPPTTRADVAYTVASIILGCWAGD